MVAIGEGSEYIRVLLVDDHELVREAFRAALETDGHLHVVGEAADGTAAIDLVQRVSADVVLLDLSMPGMSGLETLRELKRRQPELPVLVLTACGEGERETAMRGGARGFISKSDDLVHVAAVIRTAVAQSTGDARFAL